MLQLSPNLSRIISWKPGHTSEVIYMSPLIGSQNHDSMMGGVPICWPWFGQKDGLDIHGFARKYPWTKVFEESYNGGVRLAFKLNREAFTEENWLHNADVILQIQADERLELSLTTKNISDAPIHFTQAIHTYFRIGNIEEISIENLDGVEYYSKVKDQKNIQHGTLTFSGETDRIYLSERDCHIIDPELNRKIHISKKGSLSTVIWNPGEEANTMIPDLPTDDYKNFVCVEAANTYFDPVRLDPENTHTISQVISVESIQ